MDWDSLVKVGASAAVSGATSFLGAFTRFKQRIKKAETLANRATSDVQTLRQELAALRTVIESMTAGWKLEFQNQRDEFEQRWQHERELDEAREDGRGSMPDPLEELREEVHRLREQLDRMKDRQAQFVRAGTFTEHVRAQEAQWKEIARTLGRLEGLTKP